MKNKIAFAAFAAALSLSPLVFASAKINSQAPEFSELDASGKTQTLKDFAGQWVVLEWYNKDCPYVKKHYGSGNMQNIQKKFVEKGVKWLSVISSAKGKQGYLEPQEALMNVKSSGSLATAVILDPDGSMGKAYGAKTTPHMFVIDPKGTLVYSGAIDDNDSADPKVIPKSKNFVASLLDEAIAGKPVQSASTKAYGCSVKYQ